MSKKNSWKVPKNYIDYFDPRYDDDFKSKHPVLYWLTVVGIIILVCVGPFIFVALSACIEQTMEPEFSFVESLVFLFGFISSFGVSIGFCNLFLILHKQYLGHLVTIASFGIGMIGIGLSCLGMWLM